MLVSQGERVERVKKKKKLVNMKSISQIFFNL